MASHHTLHENCMVGQALAPVALASGAVTGTGTGINVSTLGGQRISFIANCGNIVSADTITFTFEEIANIPFKETILALLKRILSCFRLGENVLISRTVLAL